MTRRWLVTFGVLVILASGCGSDSSPTGTTEVGARLDEIATAVNSWESSATLPEAQAAADQARSLITGSSDGAGLLPNEAGDPGLASPLSGCAAVERDVLGGSWEDPGERWQVLADAIAAWTETNNPFPSLPSHPQRIVGWATLTLGADSLEAAHEFAGHAQIHVRVSREAVGTCQ